jgi:hypothetical protein
LHGRAQSDVARLGASSLFLAFWAEFLSALCSILREKISENSRRYQKNRRVIAISRGRFSLSLHYGAVLMA